MSPLLTVTVVISVLLGAGMLVVLFCLLTMAQRGDAYLDELERQGLPEKAVRPVRRRLESGLAYFPASASQQRACEANSPDKKMLSA
jgi:hypothetical protein